MHKTKQVLNQEERILIHPWQLFSPAEVNTAKRSKCKYSIINFIPDTLFILNPPPKIHSQIRTTFGVYDLLGVRCLWANESSKRLQKQHHFFHNPLLRFAFIIKVLKIRAIFYLNVLVMYLRNVTKKRKPT